MIKTYLLPVLLVLTGTFYCVPKIIANEISPLQLNSLSDYLKYSTLNNPELQSSFHRWKAALEESSRVTGLPDPKFTFAYFIENVETRVGPQRKKFELMQTLPWFGKLRLKGEIASQYALSLGQKYQAKQLELFYQVTKVYSEYYYIARAKETTEENIKLVKYLESVARTNYRTGRAAHLSVIRLQVELGKLEDQLISLLELRSPIVEQLNGLLNRSLKDDLPWPTDLYDKMAAPAYDDKEILSLLKEHNPNLKAATFLIQKEFKAISLAKKDYFPDFTFGVSRIETGPATMSGVVDSGKDPLAVSVSINIPFWFGKYNAAVRESVERHLVVNYQKTHLENSLYTQLKLALYRFHDSERKINLYRETLIPKGKQSLRVTQQSFEAGKVDFLSLIDTQRLLLEFELLYHRALADRLMYSAQIEMLVGRNILAENINKE